MHCLWIVRGLFVKRLSAARGLSMGSPYVDYEMHEAIPIKHSKSDTPDRFPTGIPRIIHGLPNGHPMRDPWAPPRQRMGFPRATHLRLTSDPSTVNEHLTAAP